MAQEITFLVLLIASFLLFFALIQIMKKYCDYSKFLKPIPPVQKILAYRIVMNAFFAVFMPKKYFKRGFVSQGYRILLINILVLICFLIIVGFVYLKIF